MSYEKDGTCMSYEEEDTCRCDRSNLDCPRFSNVSALDYPRF
jgi:hypothetical protein